MRPEPLLTHAYMVLKVPTWGLLLAVGALGEVDPEPIQLIHHSQHQDLLLTSHSSIGFRAGMLHN